MITRSDQVDALKVLGAYAADRTPNPDDGVLAAWMDYTDRYPNWTGDEWVAAASQLNQRPRERLVQPVDLGEIVKMWRQDALARMDPDERVRPYAELGGAPAAAPDVRRDRHGYVDKSDPADDERCPPDWTSEQRRAAYWARVNAMRDRREHRQAAEAFPTLADTAPATAASRAEAIASFVNAQRAFDDPDEQEIPYVNALRVACGFCKAPVGDRCTTWGLPGRPREKLTKIPAHPMRIRAAAIEAGFSEELAESIATRMCARQARSAKAEWTERDTIKPVPVGAQPYPHAEASEEASPHD
jgi:hypothetical protein